MTEAIETAIALRDELLKTELEQEFAVAAFPVLLERRLGSQAAAAAGADPTVQQPVPEAPAGSTSHAQVLAARVKRPAEELEDVFDFSADPVTLIVSPGRLSRTVARATEEIALLVVAARQAAANDTWTPTSEIRATCQDYARFDSSNFAGTLTDLHEEFAFRGSGRSREVRLTRPGWDKVAQLLERLSA